MVDLILTLLVINISVNLFIWSGFPDFIKKIYYKFKYPKRAYSYIELKPFDCPLCLTFWVTLIILFSIKICLFAVFLSLLNSFVATLIAPILEIISKLYYQITEKLKNKIEKI